MKKSTGALFLILGGGAFSVTVFAVTVAGVLSEGIAGFLMVAGILLAVCGCVMLARRQALPWSRGWRSRAR